MQTLSIAILVISSVSTLIFAIYAYKLRKQRKQKVPEPRYGFNDSNHKKSN